MLNNLDFTFIGKNSNLNGHFKFQATTKIAGVVEGSIEITNSSTLSLEIGSHVLANIKGHRIEIYGDFQGEIEASGTVIIYPTANVEGKILANSIEVLPGANLNLIGHTNDN